MLGGLWGWSAVTAPFPGKAGGPGCEDRPVTKGDKVYPAQVVVSVSTPATRIGLAGRTMELFTDAGFQRATRQRPRQEQGAVRPDLDPRAEEPGRPAGGEPARPDRTRSSSADAPGAGVNVVVGDRFSRLVKGPRFVVARSDTEICSPPLD